MSKATRSPTTAPSLPSVTTATTMDATLAELRRIASSAACGSHGATAPSSSPDAAVLATCADILDICAELEHAKRLSAQVRAFDDMDKWQRLLADRRAIAARRTQALRRLNRQGASTPAGVFAKLQVLDRLRPIPAGIARAVVTELLTLPGARSALWPAVTEHGEG